MEQLQIGGQVIPCFVFDAIIVGSGAAGYNTADSLRLIGVKNIAVITEGRLMGTSRNTGSDKQTYYKLSSAGDGADSVYDMAKTLYDGMSVNGDTALIEAALSSRSFYKLVNLGVPFPCNDFGEYVGYRTDHDKRTRATSCGPLTSKYMTEALERSVMESGTAVLNGHRAVSILTKDGRAYGVITVRRASVSEDNPAGICVLLAKYTVMATGGPSAIYADTVYPQSQTCAHGMMFTAGADGANLTESQYGIASLGFRWNLSGTYQQVIPRYVSVDKSGVEREFLRDYFPDDRSLFRAEFLKGYEWPFDSAKLEKDRYSSSRIDIAVYEQRKKGNRVYLDYTKDPTGFDFSILDQTALEYLKKSDAILKTPIARLKKMNYKAIAVYASHGTDLCGEPVEIAVCAQCNNGGMSVDTDWQSTSVSGLYAVGECAGTFGVYRPGGSSLNSTQVGSLRAAQSITHRLSNEYIEIPDLTDEIGKAVSDISSLLGNGLTHDEIMEKRQKYGRIMSDCAAFIRPESEISEAIAFFGNEMTHFYKQYSADAENLTDLCINRDIVVTSYVYLNAIKAYIDDGGMSRGSYVIGGDTDDVVTDKTHGEYIGITHFDGRTVTTKFTPRRPMPDSIQWFETVYNSYKQPKL